MDFGLIALLAGVGVFAALLVLTLLVWMNWRRVVETNYVHIVQSKSKRPEERPSPRGRLARERALVVSGGPLEIESPLAEAIGMEAVDVFP